MLYKVPRVHRKYLSHGDCPRSRNDFPFPEIVVGTLETLDLSETHGNPSRKIKNRKSVWIDTEIGQ